MPLYEYECVEHGRFTEFAGLSDYQLPQPCPKEGCGRRGTRVISRLQRPIVYADGGPRERARKIKEKGLVELGNERPETVARYFSEQRASAEAAEERELESAASELMNELGSDVVDAIVKESVPDADE